MKSPSEKSVRVLLFDDAFIDTKRGFSAKLNPLVTNHVPVLVPDRPWERGGIVGDSNVSLIEEDGVYRMWYVVQDPCPPDGGRSRPAAGALNDLDAKTRADATGKHRFMLCYAESTNGLRWDKPNVGLISYEGSRKNNMLFGGRLGGTVFRDPTAPPSKRYKMIHGYGPRVPFVYRTGKSPERRIFHGIYGSTSPDGLRWTPSKQPIMPWYTDTSNVAYWDDRIGKYVAFCRWNQNLGFKNNATVVMQRGAEHYRAIGRSESADFFNFPVPRKIAEPSPRERRPRETGTDYYNTSAVKLSGARDAYLMFSSNFYHDSDMLDVHLATSRDGRRYDRWKEPLLRLGDEGCFDSRQVYMGTGIVQGEDEFWMVYHGRDRRHGDRPDHGHPSGGIGRAHIRADGFVAQEASRSGGTLLTKPLAFHAGRITINMDASAGGKVSVALCDRKGEPIPGYGPRDADVLTGSGTCRPLSWKGRERLPAEARRGVRLKISARSARLYAFEG